MGNTIRCDIVTPERSLFSDEVAFVSAPAANGEVGILPSHSPFVSTLRPGELRIKHEGSEHSQRFVIAGGYIEVRDNVVRILADHARDVFDIDLDAVKARLADVEAKIKETDPESDTYAMLEEEIAWHKVQLLIAGS